MELQSPIPFPPTADAAADEALTELEVAIELVDSGVASRVRVAGIAPSVADRIGAIGASWAGAAGLLFRVERSPSSSTFTVGPRA
jgi:hypothetical protein